MALSTKERIVDAAFSFYRKSQFMEFSLSQLAKAVGITKAAIFKHFSSKEAILQAMQERMYNDIAEVFIAVQKSPGFKHERDMLLPLIVFVAEHREYLGYFLSCQPLEAERQFALAMHDRGVNIVDRMYNSNGSLLNPELYFRNMFIVITLLVFLLARDKILEHNYVDMFAVEPFAVMLTQLINEGLGEADPALDSGRMKELNSLCREAMAHMKSEDRIFTALAAVVAEKGLPGVTVERIANKLNMAKSSLYSYFSNKHEMMHSLVFGELKQLFAFLHENLKHARSCGENVYIFMRTIGEFFVRHPSVPYVSRWLGINTTEGTTDEEKKHFEFMYGLIKDVQFTHKVPEFGYIHVNDIHTIIGWFFSLPLVLQMHGRAHGYSTDTLLDAVSSLYQMVENGIGVLDSAA